MSVSIQRQEGSLTSEAKRILIIVYTGDFVSVKAELWTTMVQSRESEMSGPRRKPETSSFCHQNIGTLDHRGPK